MNRAAVYCRISQDPKSRVGRAGHAANVKTQEKDGRSLASDLKADVIGVYTDNDISAAKATVKRPEFERMMKAVEAGEFDVVIAHDQSRLSRNNTDLARLFDACEHTGTELHTVKGGPIALSADGRLSPEIINLVNVHEVRKVRERVLRRMKENAERGLPPGGPAGFGLNDDKMTINEDESALIKEAVERVLAGDPLAAIARDWNATGHTFRGRVWRSTNIRRILLAPRIAGLREHQGEVIGKGVWPAVIDRTTFERVTKLLTSPSRRTQTNNKQKLLTGLALCGKCGETLNHKWDQKGPRYYCRHCFGTLVAADHLDDLIVEMAMEALDGPALRGTVERQREEDGTTDLVVGISDLESDLADLAHELGEGRLTMPEWKAARAGIEKRLAALRSELEHEQSESALSAWVGKGGALRKGWDDLSHGQRRSVITAVFDAITVGPAIRGHNRFTPERVSVVWRA